MADVEWNMICRVCLQEGDMTSIFEKDENNKTIREKIMTCSPIRFQQNSTFPEQICSRCLDDLMVAYRFYSNCESTEAVLKSITENLIPESILVENPTYKLPADISVNRIKMNNIKDEPDSNLEEDEQIEFLDSFQYTDDSQEITYENLDLSTESVKEESELDGNITFESYEQENIEIEQPVQIIEEDQEVEVTTFQPVKSNKNRRKANQSASLGQVETIATEIDPNGFRTTIVRVKRNHVSPKNQLSPKPLKICEICGNTYKYRHALESHMRRHRGEKPFQCTVCDKAFVISFELKRHMRTHTGQKPYQCKFCERRFSDFGSRIKHERSHTGERPYSCSQCGKTFAYSHVLSSHMLIHTGEKKYQCPECGKKFTKSHHLKAHKNTHLRAMNKILNKITNTNPRNQNVKTIKQELQSSTIVLPQGMQTTVLKDEIHLETHNLADFAKDNNLLGLDVITIFESTKNEPKSDDEDDLNDIIVEQDDVIEDMMGSE